MGLGMKRLQDKQNQQSVWELKDREELVAVLNLLRVHRMQVLSGACTDTMLPHGMKEEFPVPSLAHGTGPAASLLRG